MKNKLNTITISSLKKGNFYELYYKFMLNRCNVNELRKILSIAIVLLNSNEEFVKKIGYDIVLHYANFSGDYSPLYEIAINNNYMPIAAAILRNKEESFFNLFSSSLIEAEFKYNNIILTNEQKKMQNFYRKHDDESTVIIAPTSYGKSDMIIDCISRNKEKNICIIVPTKALVMQTYKKIIGMKAINKRNVYTSSAFLDIDIHKKYIFVFTQERYLNLLKFNENIDIDLFFIDEAHLLLEESDRSKLLAQVLIVSRILFPKAIFKFSSPFIADIANLQLKFVDINMSDYRVNENIKLNNVYVISTDGENTKRYIKEYYNPYNDKFYRITDYNKLSVERLILNYNDNHNIIYLNKTNDIEEFSCKLSLVCDINNKLIEISNAIAEYVHPEYYLAHEVKHGVVYHHGTVNANIRSFIEYIYNKYDEIKYIICSSTLLEGVNLKGDNLFILDCKKGRKNMSNSTLKNLIGRVGRLSNIFTGRESDLKKLESKVFFIESTYWSKKTRVRKFLSDVFCYNRKYKDRVENVLLKRKKIDSIEEKREKININNTIKYIFKEEMVYTPRTLIGKGISKYSISEIDIEHYEEEIDYKFELCNVKVDNINDFFVMCKDVFFAYVNDLNLEKDISNNELMKLYITYYSFKIEGYDYRDCIDRMVYNWKQSSGYVYVFKWGDFGKYQNKWIDCRMCSDIKLVNIAIKVIECAEQFLEYHIVRFLDLLYELGKIDLKFYNMFKYGTNDKLTIIGINEGFSRATMDILRRRYRGYLALDMLQTHIIFSSNIIECMKKNNENIIAIYEVEGYI